MPLPWLIGAAVVAVAATVAKVVSDDDSPRTSDSGEAERRRQEREARIQRERENLTSKASNLKKDRLAEAREHLACSAAGLANLPRVTTGITTPKIESALMDEQQASSEYAQSMGEILDMPNNSQNGLQQKDRQEFLVNLRVLENFYGPIPFDNEGKRDLAALRQIGMQLNRLVQLKQQIEEQG